MSPTATSTCALTAASPGSVAGFARLEGKGLIERRPDTRDRRVVNLHLTDFGRSLVDEAFTTSLALYEAMVEGLTSTEKETLAELQERMLERLEQLSGQRQQWNP